MEGLYMKTILVIDEDEMTRDNTTEILELSNYRVLSVENGSRGLDVAINKHPDLIICDEMMPQMEGLEVLKKIRKMVGVNKIPFILVTTPAEGSDIGSGLREGTNEFLAKPFHGEELLRVVAKCLQGGQAFR